MGRLLTAPMSRQFMILFGYVFLLKNNAVSTPARINDAPEYFERNENPKTNAAGIKKDLFDSSSRAIANKKIPANPKNRKIGTRYDYNLIPICNIKRIKDIRMI